MTCWTVNENNLICLPLKIKHYRLRKPEYSTRSQKKEKNNK